MNEFQTLPAFQYNITARTSLKILLSVTVDNSYKSDTMLSFPPQTKSLCTIIEHDAIILPQSQVSWGQVLVVNRSDASLNVIIIFKKLVDQVNCHFSLFQAWLGDQTSILVRYVCGTGYQTVIVRVLEDSCMAACFLKTYIYTFNKKLSSWKKYGITPVFQKLKQYSALTRLKLERRW